MASESDFYRLFVAQIPDANAAAAVGDRALSVRPISRLLPGAFARLKTQFSHSIDALASLGRGRHRARILCARPGLCAQPGSSDRRI